MSDGFSTPNSIVPFGKYKGEPVEVLLADRSYQDWLLAQDWFRDRYATIYQTVINYGGAPQDSPEHNELQLAFLDDDVCLRLAKLLVDEGYWSRIQREYQDAVEALRYIPGCTETITSPEIQDRTFENQGWDVTFTVLFENRKVDVPCTCVCDHSNCGENSYCRTRNRGYGYCSHGHHYKDADRQTPHCDIACAWTDAEQNKLLSKYVDDYGGKSVVVHVECKPDLGDDFPTILRQVKRYPKVSGAGWPFRTCVVARRMGFERVSREQVSAAFASSGISLILESEIL